MPSGVSFALSNGKYTTNFLVTFSGAIAFFGAGAGFAATKAFEYADKIGAGLTMVHNDFFMFYWTLTGLHFVHFLIGMVVLGVCLYKARQDALDARFVVWIESGGCYWHMVDLLWIMIFPMIYLLRAA